MLSFFIQAVSNVVCLQIQHQCASERATLEEYHTYSDIAGKDIHLADLDGYPFTRTMTNGIVISSIENPRIFDRDDQSNSIFCADTAIEVNLIGCRHGVQSYLPIMIECIDEDNAELVAYKIEYALKEFLVTGGFMKNQNLPYGGKFITTT